MTDDADRLPRMPVPPGAEGVEIGELTAAHGADQPLGVVSAAMTVGTVALMILGVQPVVLGALAQAGRVSEAQLGNLATAEVLALAFGSAVGPALMRGGGMRLKAGALSLLLGVANLAIYAVHGVLALDLLRGVAGLIEGLMMGATIIVLIQDRRPDRMNAIFLALSTAPQALMAYLLPVWVTPHFGPEGGFVILAGLSALSAASCLFLADQAPEVAAEGGGKVAWTVPIFAALLAVGLQNAAIGGAWGYMQLLADQHHFPAQAAGIAVSGGLVFQVGGALAVAAWGHRLPYALSLVVGSLCQAGVIALLAVAGTPAAYLAPALGFGLFWLALNPFQVRLLIGLDETRTAATLLTAVTLVGLSLGPSLSALGVAGADVTGAFWIAAGLMAAAAALYSIFALRRAA
ncbi:hypothetical protein [Phenylobacterium montanum]|uniref:MFS transporter n=1 Tax=Phenylobacterium montanum TaxID=2823693 RepID=A0A975FVN9_9CAUL|nr:hypothetical protein [Caulobacter sp. S6]QUD86170.1 hypothetical protein KCG34_13780 [Caulobacter sp. S6]